MTIVDVFEAVGAHAAGKITDEELHELEEAASPGIGACGGQFTANTMAMAFEVLGLSPMGSAMVPAAYEDKNRVATEAGALIMDVLRPRPAPARHHHPRGAGERDRRDRHERRLHQRRAAPARAGARGGRGARRSTTSTGSREQTPTTCDLKPGGRFVAKDLYEAGGIARRRQAPARGRACCTRTSRPSPARTIGEHAREAVETPGQEVVRPVDDPVKKTGGLAILRGNLAPEGSVIKLSGHER